MSSAPTTGATTGLADGTAAGPEPFAPGELVDGRYLLGRRIGRGTSSTVWHARDEILHRDVALKRLVGNPTWSPEQADAARARARREGRVAARLHHPKLAAIYDLIEVGGDVCLVMEYVDAPSLARLVEAGGPLAPERVAHVGAQVAEGLAAAHAAGVLHRDVKPANVLVDRDGAATLTDFGIARLAGTADATATASGLLTGTPHFMAPETAQGAPADATADVYALGATLLTAVEGRPPVGEGPNVLDTLRRVAAGQLLPMRLAGPLAPALARLLDHDPARRPAITEVAGLLRGAVGLPPEPGPDRLSPSASRGHGTLVDALPAVPPATPYAAPSDTPSDTPSDAVPPTAPVAVHPAATSGPDRRRRLAVGTLLGAAGLAGVVGGAVALTTAASTTPVAATGSAAPVPRVDAPPAPLAAPPSAPPIVPPPDPALDLGPTVVPAAPPALAAAATPAAPAPRGGDDGRAHRHHRASGGDATGSKDADRGEKKGKHRSDDQGKDGSGKKDTSKDTSKGKDKDKDKDRGDG